MIVSKIESEIISRHLYEAERGFSEDCSMDLIRTVVEDAIEKDRIIFSIVGYDIEYIMLFRMLSNKNQACIPFAHVVDGLYCFVDYFYCSRNYDGVCNEFFGRYNPREFIFQRGVRNDYRFHYVSIERFKKLFKKV